MTIQWYPGHMTVARREAAKTMEKCDVVVEVLDARTPEASSNPMISELRKERQRPCLKILNKADLADPSVTQAWVRSYNQEDGVSAVALTCTRPGQAAKIPHLCQPLAPNRTSSLKPLRMLIMGIPNVGKSTLMNALLKRRLAKVGDQPAVTRVQQKNMLNDHMMLIDSPGLLWPKIEDPDVGLMLATINAISAKVVVDEEIADFLLSYLVTHYPTLFTKRYGFSVEGLNELEVLDAIAKKRGCLRKGKGGEFDREKAARILLLEFRNGTLGQISLQTPETPSTSE